MFGLEPTILGSLQNAQEEAMFLDNFAGTYVSGCDQIYPWWMISFWADTIQDIRVIRDAHNPYEEISCDLSG